MRRVLLWLCMHGVHLRQEPAYTVVLKTGRYAEWPRCKDCGAPV